MSTIHTIGAVCRNVVQQIKSLEVTLTRKALEMTGARNSPYAQNIQAVIASKRFNTDISDKTVGKLEAMFNSYVFWNADRTDQQQFFVGQRASGKVASYDLMQIRQEVQNSRVSADQCKPLVKEKFHAILDSFEQKLGHMEYPLLEKWDGFQLSKAERAEVQKQLGYFPAACSGRPSPDWAPQALAKHPGVKYFYQEGEALHPKLVAGPDGDRVVYTDALGTLEVSFPQGKAHRDTEASPAR